MSKQLKRYRFEATFEKYYWGCIINAYDKRSAVLQAFKELNIPNGASFMIEVVEVIEHANRI